MKPSRRRGPTADRVSIPAPERRLVPSAALRRLIVVLVLGSTLSGPFGLAVAQRPGTAGSPAASPAGAPAADRSARSPSSRTAAKKTKITRAYPESDYGPASLRYVAHVPVLKVYGSPEAIGEQCARLLGDAGALAGRRYLDKILIGPLRNLVMMQSRKMEKHIPDDYLREMRAFAEHSSLSYEDVLLINTFADIKKLIRCTTIAVAPDRNPHGTPLLGRNFDFPSFGFAHRYGLVIVYHPTGRKAFASVGHPGLVGTHSFVNTDGLAGAVMEVYSGKRKFNPHATPALMLYRRVAESCATIAPALAILEKGPRCSSNNLMLQTAGGDAALAEFTVEKFAVRRPEKGLLFGTNHHRAPALNRNPRCWRMSYLQDEQKDEAARWSLEQVIARLRRTALGRLNFYSMVFDPAERTIHLAMGRLPAAKAPFIKLDREALFAKNPPRRRL